MVFLKKRMVLFKPKAVEHAKLILTLNMDYELNSFISDRMFVLFTDNEIR